MKTQLLRSVAFGTCLTALSMTGCQLAENQLKIDRDNNLEFQDIRDSMAPREIPADALAAAKADGVPDFQDYTAMTAKDLKPMPLVTISVNESIPLKDVLYELAQQANYDVELDPRIEGAIIFTARNRPFDEVMERIADLGSLRYKFVNNVVRVELDTPYSETYKIDYLAAIRNSTTTIENNATVTGGGDASASTGSTFKLSGNSDIDFWKELDSNIKQILESNSPENALRTQSTPTVSVAPVVQDPNSPPAAPAPTGNPLANASNASNPGNASATASPAVNVQATATPADPTVESAQSKLVPTYSLNRQGGLLSVFANEKVHRKIKSYLDDLRSSVGAQVLIEAKVFQVDLNDEFATGINWSALAQSGGEFSIAYDSGSPPLPGLDPASTAALTLGYTGNDLSTIINAVSRFGTVHALASPRLTVVNNQSAVLNVAKNTTYFEIDVTTSSTDTVSTTTVDSTAKSVPEGVLVNVTPAIDLVSKQITMTIRPTISRIDSFVNDPGVAFAIAQSGLSGSAAAALQSKVPNVTVQEFDSVMKVKSGEVMVMGGLLKDRSESEQNGVPVLSETPLIGGLFRKQADKVGKSEIVVFLRATIVDDGAQTIHQTDRDLYKMFSQDRRPFPL
jgi:MSHA biogenesis protein MshL